MIRIIKKGTRETITCQECGCFFSYEEEDIITENKNFIGGYQPATKKVICPQCGKEVQLYAER